jgi:hypothetical protein
MSTDDIQDEIWQYTTAMLKKCEDLIEQLEERKSPDGCPPYYLDFLGMSYAMALSYAILAGNKEADVQDHLTRTIASAKMSITENKKMLKERVHH